MDEEVGTVVSGAQAPQLPLSLLLSCKMTGVSWLRGASPLCQHHCPGDLCTQASLTVPGPDPQSWATGCFSRHNQQSEEK